MGNQKKKANDKRIERELIHWVSAIRRAANNKKGLLHWCGAAGASGQAPAELKVSVRLLAVNGGQGIARRAFCTIGTVSYISGISVRLPKVPL